MKKFFTFQNILMAIIALALWILVLQNFGIIKKDNSVRVNNTVDVTGEVEVSGYVNCW